MFKKIIGALSVAIFVLCTFAYAVDESGVGWKFNPATGMQGWTCNAHLEKVDLGTGGISATVCGRNPTLFGPVLQKPIAVDQYVEIRLKGDTPGEARLFWATTLEGKYNGFSGKESIRFALHGDSKFHTYRVYPFWHSGPELRRLRLDLPFAGRFTLASVRVVTPAERRTTSDKTAWQFKEGLQGWQLVDVAEVADGKVSLMHQDGQLVLRSADPAAAIASPALSMDAKKHFYVSFRMATDRGTAGSIFAIAKRKPGRESIGFPLVADGKMHTYNVDVGSLGNWQNEILCVGIRPTDATSEATTRFEFIKFADKPVGPVDLRCRYFGPRDTLSRTTRPTTVACTVENFGGTAAEGVTLQLKSASPDVQVVGESTQSAASIPYAVPHTATWKLACSKPGTYPLSVTVLRAGKPVLTKSANVTFTEVPVIAQEQVKRAGGYIPEPQPVHSKLEIGAYYFPGWHSINKWGPIFDYPNRRPAMGWYDEATPECVDWQIKWATEHGIDFFMVDWYWNRGGQYLGHWIHKGLAQAKFKKYLKWCVMWANHNGPGSHSVEDWKEATQFWIDNYFGLEEYYRIDEKPVVVIWSPAGIRRDVGGAEGAAKLYAMSQEMAKKAGYKGIYFVAMFNHENKADYQTLHTEGYHAATSYHATAPAIRKHPGRKYFDFQDLVETSPSLWEREEADSGTMDYFPIVDTGWDSRPWHKDLSNVFDHRTPEKFKTLCEKAKKFAEANGSRLVMLGPWNEWGEGSYIEPYAEYGFGDLDAIREVFCKPGVYPPNLVPEDLGRGPYELPMPEETLAWEFDSEEEMNDWDSVRLEATYRDGCFHGKAGGGHPVLFGPPVRNQAERINRATIRMRSDRNSMARFFWSTTTQEVCANNSVSFKVIGDGRFHEYAVDLASHPGWRGLITALRLDPVHTPDAEFDIDYIRLEKSDK